MKLGDAAMRDGKFQDALKYYDEVKTLVSTYNQAQVKRQTRNIFWEIYFE